MTDTQISKLPKWAQEHIRQLQRQRDIAVRELREYMDSQTESKVYYDDLTCLENGAPSQLRRYVQTNKIAIVHEGVELDIYAAPGDGIRIRFGVMKHGRHRIASIRPNATNSISILASEVDHDD